VQADVLAVSALLQPIRCLCVIRPQEHDFADARSVMEDFT
jgi:hypothetical protein